MLIAMMATVLFQQEEPAVGDTAKVLRDRCAIVDTIRPGDTLHASGSYCLGYITGWARTRFLHQEAIMRFLQSDPELIEQRAESIMTTHGALACDSVGDRTHGQIIRVFNRWVDEHPEFEDITGAAALSIATQEAWGC